MSFDFKKEKKSEKKKSDKLNAKKDFVISQNEFHFEIKKGDDLSKFPKRFMENLKTEGVI